MRLIVHYDAEKEHWHDQKPTYFLEHNGESVELPQKLALALDLKLTELKLIQDRRGQILRDGG